MFYDTDSADVCSITDLIQMITQLQNLGVISECQSRACKIRSFYCIKIETSRSHNVHYFSSFCLMII